jgi:hypothetical protein
LHLEGSHNRSMMFILQWRGRVDGWDFSSHYLHFPGLNGIPKLENPLSFQSTIKRPTCQGIKLIGRDRDLGHHITTTLPSPRWMPLKTPSGSCRQPLMKSRGRWPHCIGRGMKPRPMLKFGRETYQFSVEITAVCKPPSVGWHCDLLIYRQGFTRIIQSFKFRGC